jgi:ribosomal protein L11 methyltransferase
VRAGRHVLLQPAWLPVGDAAAEGDVIVLLDPGRSFGSGSHPSTRLVLAALEDVIGGGERVLDVGCGSGVLAVAAARLGAASVVAVDIDPEAIEVTAANAARNGVAEQVAASTESLEELDGTFDVVLANIGVRVLTDLAGALVEAVGAGGTLVLAGLLEDQADGVVAACVGTTELSKPVEDGWAAPVLRRDG